MSVMAGRMRRGGAIRTITVAALGLIASALGWSPAWAQYCGTSNWPLTDGLYQPYAIDEAATRQLRLDIARRHREAAFLDLWANADPAVAARDWPVIGPRLNRTVALVMAVAGDDAKDTRSLLAAGAYLDLDTHDPQMTPLVDAAFCASPPIVEQLLAAGAKPNQTSAYDDGAGGTVSNFTALAAAVDRGDLGIVQALLKGGADPNIPPEDANRSPMNTTEDGPLLLDDPAPITAALLKAGADPNAADANGETALMAAAAVGDAQDCALLLQAGADKTHKNAAGQDAAKAAAKAGHNALAAAITVWKPGKPLPTQQGG